MSELNTNNLDRLVSVAKGIIGVCPAIGPLASEAIGSLIPNQRLERVVNFVLKLEEYTEKVDSRLNMLETNLKTPEGLDIFEEGLIQASKAVSRERQQQLAVIIAISLTNAQVKYSESKKILNIFRELTDPEILWLLYYSTTPTLGSEFHNKLRQDNPEILKPVSREFGAPQEQVDRGALQDSYKNTLLRLGLVEKRRSSIQISSLGRLLVRYIESQHNNNSIS